MKHVSVGDFRDYHKLVERLKLEAESSRGGEETVIGGTHGAWTVNYSISSTLGHIFSLRVRQNSTKERDWVILGKMATLIGAPLEAMPDTIASDPNATHYWLWGSTVGDEEARRQLKAAIDAHGGRPKN